MNTKPHLILHFAELDSLRHQIGQIFVFDKSGGVTQNLEEGDDGIMRFFDKATAIADFSTWVTDYYRLLSFEPQKPFETEIFPRDGFDISDAQIFEYSMKDPSCTNQKHPGIRFMNLAVWATEEN